MVAAIGRQAERGNQFLLPTAEAMDFCCLLTEQFGPPQWQFTISASGANTDALRLARVATGRSVVLIFDGKYHGPSPGQAGAGLAARPAATRRAALDSAARPAVPGRIRSVA